jgi:biopolymer transport protein ExbB
MDTLSTGAAAGGESLFSLLVKGGPLMIPIALLFVSALFIFFERLLTIRKASRIDPYFMNNIRDQVSSGNLVAALDLCARTNSPIARLIEKGIRRIGKPIPNIDAAIESVGKVEMYKLEKGMGFLGATAGMAPMFGFVGTIIGVITIFHDIAQSGTFSIGVLASGLYVKMITSAAGLMTGILAFAAHHILNAKIDRVVHEMELRTIEFLDLIQETPR